MRALDCDFAKDLIGVSVTAEERDPGSLDGMTDGDGAPLHTRLPVDEALVMAVTQKAPVGSTFGNAVSDPAWKRKPTWYRVSTSDRVIHPDSERGVAQRINPQSTIELDANHASLASQPGAIVNLIDKAADSLT